MTILETTIWELFDSGPPKQLEHYSDVLLPINVGDKYFIPPNFYIVENKTFQHFHGNNKTITLNVHVKFMKS